MECRRQRHTAPVPALETRHRPAKSEHRLSCNVTQSLEFYISSAYLQIWRRHVTWLCLKLRPLDACAKKCHSEMLRNPPTAHNSLGDTRVGCEDYCKYWSLSCFIRYEISLDFLIQFAVCSSLLYNMTWVCEILNIQVTFFPLQI